MQPKTARRIAALAAVAALPSTLLGVGVGAGAANAANPDCKQSMHWEKNDWSTVGISHTYDKSTVAEAAAGTNITYKVVVGTTSIGNPYVNTIWDYPPVGFGKPVSAKVTAYHFPGGQKTEDVTPEPNEDGSWRVSSTGWFVNSGNPVTAEFTYRVPDRAQTGVSILSGGAAFGGTVGVGTTIPELSACFTVREKNTGESTLGSADGAGLGSTEGQLSSTGSLSDFTADTITKIIKNLGGS
ncbi:hypothetical protein [Rhodococcus tukisamuensis]|uniref:Alternate signal-mediated exported protein, RER_14450 family n=1 Tax=Rhodococcus tukisamuensis TaxID=168276 RepID=A0A1G6W5R0_9NOCA|nr:hypothetical protein [Rhodococcus tukisamuensis]SDD61212.1 hypothetical protein SAMN05444580_105261 [Rhodococcus tukisamuensis]